MPNKLRISLFNDSTHAWICFFLLASMISTLFFSRFVLVVSLAGFFTYSLLWGDIKKRFSIFFSTPLLWGMSLLFLLPLVSGLWSDDKEQWLDMMRIKLPLLILPFAFTLPIKFTKKQWDWLTIIFIACVFIGSLWTFAQYLNNVHDNNEGYLRAKTMITPLDNDHVRFSLLVSIAIILSGYLAMHSSKKLLYVFIPLIAWLVLFLHLLAARTGLLTFYIMLILVVLWLAFVKKKWLVSSIVMISLFVLPVLAYQSFPSFRNKLKFFLYEKGFFEKTNYLQGGTDAVRVVSIKAGWELMNQYPLFGVGFGDIAGETRKWYGSEYPRMDKADKIYPSNEWLIYGTGCGWPGFLIFCLAVFIPFFSQVKNNLIWVMLNTGIATSFLFDIGLEVQFGVFIYSFSVLWWWKWFRAEIS